MNLVPTGSIISSWRPHRSEWPFLLHSFHLQHGRIRDARPLIVNLAVLLSSKVTQVPSCFNILA